MRHQIRTLQVPTGWGTGAFVSVPAKSSTAQFNGQNIVTGAPGTVPVPSPAPCALDDSSLGGPYNQPSSVAPNYFLPSIYVAHVNETMHFPGDSGSGRITYITPIPAQAPGNIVVDGFGKPRIGGDTVTRSVRPFTVWKQYK